MNNHVYIIGGVQTDFQRNWTKEGKSFIAMVREISKDLLIETGIDYREIKLLNKKNRIELFVGNFDGEQYFNQSHLGAFLTEIDPAFYGVPGARYEAACASGSAAIDCAVTKIRVGDIDVAIVLGIEMMKTVGAKAGGDFLGTAAYYEKEAKNKDYPFPKLFSQLANVFIEKYALDEDRYLNCLSGIATKNYSNAKRNIKSQTRNWFMNLDHSKRRNTVHNSLVGGKLAVSDCSQITDGAAAVILVSDNYFRKYKYKMNKKRKYSQIIGWGHRTAPILFSEKIRESSKVTYILPWTRQAVLDALNMAKLPESKIDCYETHDCFTSSEYAAISAFGLTAPGEEYKVIESGEINFFGKKPINPSGGLIGGGHPVGATGVRMILDLHKQVTDTAGGYQVKNVSNAMMLNIGGSATSNYVFIVKRT